MTENIVSYRGKCVDELTRQEAIAAVKLLGGMLASYQTPERSLAFALGSVEMLKRGEKQLVTNDQPEKS